MNAKRKMSRRFFIGAIATILVGGVVILLVVVAMHILQPQFPTNVRKEAAFTVFYPVKGTTGIVPVRSSISYDTAESGLSYTTLVHGQKVIVSMQATPEVFAEGPVYDFKLQQSHEFSSFETRLGEITLTKPDGLHGQVVAVGDSQGTLVFAHAIASLTASDWKQLFNAFEAVSN